MKSIRNGIWAVAIAFVLSVGTAAAWSVKDLVTAMREGKDLDLKNGNYRLEDLESSEIRSYLGSFKDRTPDKQEKALKAIMADVAYLIDMYTNKRITFTDFHPNGQKLEITESFCNGLALHISFLALNKVIEDSTCYLQEVQELVQEINTWINPHEDNFKKVSDHILVSSKKRSENAYDTIKKSYINYPIENKKRTDASGDDKPHSWSNRCARIWECMKSSVVWCKNNKTMAAVGALAIISAAWYAKTKFYSAEQPLAKKMVSYIAKLTKKSS